MRRWLLIQLGIAATAAGVTVAALIITIVGLGYLERIGQEYEETQHGAHRVETVSQK